MAETRRNIPSHGDIYDFIMSKSKTTVHYRNHGGSSHSQISPRHKCPSHVVCSIPEFFKDEEYTQRRLRFEKFYHNGRWKDLHRESNKCINSGVPEIIAIGYLELALGLIFQRNEFEVKRNISLADQAISEIEDEVLASFLKARCKYLLSLSYRYLNRFEEARCLAKEALIILNLAEVGEDKAFAQYCYAIVLAEESYISQFGRRTFEDVLSELHKSVEYAKRTEDMEILVTHSQLQLSRLYLGTTHT